MTTSALHKTPPSTGGVLCVTDKERFPIEGDLSFWADVDIGPYIGVYVDWRSYFIFLHRIRPCGKLMVPEK